MMKTVKRSILSIEYIKDTDSTNAELKRRIINSTKTQFNAISAEFQTAGRGRRGREWMNTEGALMMSIAVSLQGVESNSYHLVTIASAVAVCDSICALGVDAGIKWPNDILVGGYKICGILTEVTQNANNIPFAVIGIGVNANADSMPAGLMQPAKSLKIITGKSTDKKQLAEMILNEVIIRIADIKNGRSDQVLKAYNRLGITVGRSIVVHNVDGSVFEAVARCIDRFGHLVVESSKGVSIIDSADVSVRFE